MFNEQIDGLKFLFSVGSLRYLMLGTVLSSVLLAGLKKTTYSETMFYVTRFYFVFLLNYYLLSSIAGLIKIELEPKKIILVSVFTSIVTSFLFSDFYTQILVLGFLIWMLIESYSFSIFTWDITEKIKQYDRKKVLAAVIVPYVAYLLLKLFFAIENQDLFSGSPLSTFDFLFGAVMFFFAFSKMGSRFKDTKSVGNELVSVFVMVITLSYVLFVYSPFDQDQVFYYAVKIFGLFVGFSIFLIVRKITEIKTK